MMDGRTVGRPRPVRASDGDGLPNGAHGNAMGRSRQYRRRLADAQDLRLRPNSHGFTPRVGCGVPSSRLARMIRIGLTIIRSEEHTSELPSLMRISYAVFCLKKKKTYITTTHKTLTQYTKHNHNS